MKRVAILALSAILAGCSSARLPSLEDTAPPASASSKPSQLDPSPPDPTRLGSSEQNPSPSLSLGQPIALTAEQRADVERGVKNKLADPGSATFGAMNAVVSKRTTKGYVVCGWVNTKPAEDRNAGDQPFIALYAPDSRIALLLGLGGEADARTVKTQCVAEGVPLGA